MKKYICLNHGECNWADEIPPREFSLDEVDINCPNCGSANIREPVPEQNKLKRLLPFIAGAVLLLCLIWLFWPKENSAGTHPVQPPKDTTVKVYSSKKAADTTVVDLVDSNTATPIQNTEPASDRPRKAPLALTWTMVEGSGFCDPSLDGTYLYTERNNLGQERERKVQNRAGCYPASR